MLDPTTHAAADTSQTTGASSATPGPRYRARFQRPTVVRLVPGDMPWTLAGAAEDLERMEAKAWSVRTIAMVCVGFGVTAEVFDEEGRACGEAWADGSYRVTVRDSEAA